MNEQERYERAKKRVKAIRGFYVHLTVFALVSALLLAINLITSPGKLWFYWPLFGWGIAIVIHAIGVYGGKSFGPEWEERKIRELMAKDKGE